MSGRGLAQRADPLSWSLHVFRVICATRLRAGHGLLQHVHGASRLLTRRADDRPLGRRPLATGDEPAPAATKSSAWPFTDKQPCRRLWCTVADPRRFPISLGIAAHWPIATADAMA